MSRRAELSDMGNSPKALPHRTFVNIPLDFAAGPTNQLRTYVHQIQRSRPNSPHDVGHTTQSQLGGIKLKCTYYQAKIHMSSSQESVGFLSTHVVLAGKCLLS